MRIIIAQCRPIDILKKFKFGLRIGLNCSKIFQNLSGGLAKMRNFIHIKCLFCLTLLVFIFLSACVKEPRGAPKWDIELNIPIISDTLSLEDMLVDSILGDMDTLLDTLRDTLTFTITRDLDPQYIRDSLQIENTYDTVTLTLSDFTLTGYQHSKTFFLLPELVPDSIAQMVPDTGAYMPIPYFSKTVGKFDTLPDIRHLSITQGRASLKIRNFLKFTIDTLNLSIVNPLLNREIIHLDITELEGFGDSAFVSIPLNDVQVDSVVGVSLHIVVLGTSPDSTVHLHPMDSVVVEFSVDSLRISSATVLGGEMHAEHAETTVIQLPYGILLDTLQVAHGFLNLLLTNTFSTGIQLGVRINEFGVDTTVFLRPRGGQVPLSFDLSNYQYVRTTPRNTISGHLWVNFNLPDTAWITIRQNDSLKMSYALEDVEFQRAVLTIDTPIVQEFERESFELPDVPEFAESLGIQFMHTVIRLDVVSGIGIPADFELHIHAPEWDTLYRAVIRPGTPIRPETTRLFLEISDLLNTYPDSVTVWGRSSVFGHGEIWGDAFVSGHFQMIFPLIVSWDTITITNESEVDIDSSTRDDIRDAPEIDGGLILFVSNSLPFAIDSARLTAIDTDHIEGKPERDSIVIKIGGIPFPPMENGIVVGDTTQRLDLRLTNDQLKFFADADSIRSELFVPASDSGVVFLRHSDFYKISFWGVLNIRMRIDPENMGED